MTIDATPRRPHAFAVAAGLLALVLAGGVAELTSRFVLHAPPPAPPDERNLLYQFDDRLGWFPVPSSLRTYTGSRTITVSNNRMGFRDREHGAKQKPRIVVVGDSFVWGYDAEQDERFTERLQAALPGFEVLNTGVSGYGTDQELLMLEARIDQLQPDLVLLIFCAENDQDDNASNLRYGYYKPYFTMVDRVARSAGVPVPRSLRYYHSEWPSTFGLVDRSAFLTRLTNRAFARLLPAEVTVPDPTFAIVRRMKTLTDGRGVPLVCGITASRPDLDAAFRREGVPCVDLSTPFRYPSHGNHWTPEGHMKVAERLQAFLALWLDALRARMKAA